MIAQRFRSVVWVGGVALAALLLYIVSLQVATERGRLEEIDRQVASTQREIRQLQTEMGTRANLRQLERWNGEVLALTAPKASQFISGEQDIAKISRENMGDATAAPPPVMAAVMLNETAPSQPPASRQTSEAVASAAPSPVVAPQPVKPAVLSQQDRQVQHAFDTLPRASAKPVAMASAQSSSSEHKPKSAEARAGAITSSDGGKSRK